MENRVFLHMKVVLNCCYGGFSLSEEAENRLRELGCKHLQESDRTNPALVQVVEELGEKASGQYANLQVKRYNDHFIGKWKIREYDGAETIVLGWRELLASINENLNQENVDEWKQTIREILNSEK